MKPVDTWLCPGTRCNGSSSAAARRFACWWSVAAPAVSRWRWRPGFVWRTGPTSMPRIGPAGWFRWSTPTSRSSPTTTAVCGRVSNASCADGIRRCRRQRGGVGAAGIGARRREQRWTPDAVLLLTHAAAQGWPGESGLAVDGDGFIRVDGVLQSLSHPVCFAAGDIASMPDPAQVRRLCRAPGSGSRRHPVARADRPHCATLSPAPPIFSA